MTNVVTMKPEASEDDAPDEADVLWSRYLKAQGRFHDNTLDQEAMGRAGNAVTQLVWQIIQCRGSQSWHIKRKLKVLQDMLADSDLNWIDCRERMLLESAIADLEHL